MVQDLRENLGDAVEDVGFDDIFKAVFGGPSLAGRMAWHWRRSWRGFWEKFRYLFGLFGIVAAMYGMPLRACIVVAIVAALWAGISRGYAHVSPMLEISSGASFGALIAILAAIFGYWGLAVGYAIFLGLYLVALRGERRRVLNRAAVDND